MVYKIIYYYDSTIDLDNVHTKLVEDMVTGEVPEAIALCSELKNKGEPIPVGFSIMSYDEYDMETCETKNYFINGKLIDRKNLPSEWDKDLLNKDVRQLVYINNDFCVPFHEATDTILTIGNL